MHGGSLPPQAALLPWVHAGQVAERLPAVLNQPDLRATVRRLEDTNLLLRQTVVRLRGQLRFTERPDAYLGLNVRCGHCHEWLPAESFSTDLSRKSGLRGRCRDCDSISRAQKAGAA